MIRQDVTQLQLVVALDGKSWSSKTRLDIRKDMIENEIIWNEMVAASVADNMKEARLR